jgi:hypothetical protein
MLMFIFPSPGHILTVVLVSATVAFSTVGAGEDSCVLMRFYYAMNRGQRMFIA